MALFYEHTWVRWTEPTKPANLLALVQKVVGSHEAAERVLEATKSDEVKKVLAKNTDSAFKDGAFGLPYFVGEYIT
jgi:2-hydroxychromene-2-carboxylate isomerase